MNNVCCTNCELGTDTTIFSCICTCEWLEKIKTYIEDGYEPRVNECRMTHAPLIIPERGMNST